MIVGIQEEILKLQSQGLLGKLLKDKTTGRNIRWASSTYRELGSAYAPDREITPELITGGCSAVIKNRARKALEKQSQRTKQHAEVFTPLAVCKRMNDDIDEVWAESNPSWQKTVDSRRLEITCGEAPFLVTRYDVSTGEHIPVSERVGILDRKLRLVNENTDSGSDWLRWARRAFEASYGYEFQGDNLLIARINLLQTFKEAFKARFNVSPPVKLLAEIANVIVWNVWQMDGLTHAVPNTGIDEESEQLDFFAALNLNGETSPKEETIPPCKIFDWRGKKSIAFKELKNRRKYSMKFDFIIGNPPYQEEANGGNKTFTPPLYNQFIDNCYSLSDVVELIHPARFLFNAGSTPKEWNQKMLNDPHLKILHYEPSSSNIFPNTDIKGGVAITYHDEKKDYEPIQVFLPYPELASIRNKISQRKHFTTFTSIIYIQNRFNLNSLYNDYPAYRSIIGSNGKDKRFEKNIFNKIPLFTKEETSKIKVLGLINNRRVYRFIQEKYVDHNHENLHKYKVLLPTVNGSGAFGEVISTPFVGPPFLGYTRSFIGIGAFDSVLEAEAALKYVKSKFARSCLGILKITQQNPPETWKYVPLQDFTANSDIDWTKTIPEIDRQLYAKYGLDENEIAFIETRVKAMED